MAGSEELSAQTHSEGFGLPYLGVRCLYGLQQASAPRYLKFSAVSSVAAHAVIHDRCTTRVTMRTADETADKAGTLPGINMSSSSSKQLHSLRPA